MLVNFIRAIIIYIIVLVVMRLMGKREIGQLQPFELVISIMIADLASIPMTDTGVPIFNGIVPILGLLAMHLLITVLNIKSVNIITIRIKIVNKIHKKSLKISICNGFKKKFKKYEHFFAKTIDIFKNRV